MDNLARCALLAKKAGVSYGQWMAIHGEKVITKKDEILPPGWKLCEECGKPFRSRCGKMFCDGVCAKRAYYKKNHDQILEARKICYRERKKQNEGSC